MPVNVNTLRPRQNGRRFADDTFKRIFLNENVRVSIRISLKFVPKSPVNNNPALVQIMAWRLPGDKPLSEPIMVSLLTHICVTRPQWVKCVWVFADTVMNRFAWRVDLVSFFCSKIWYHTLISVNGRCTCIHYSPFLLLASTQLIARETMVYSTERGTLRIWSGEISNKSNRCMHKKKYSALYTIMTCPC